MSVQMPTKASMIEDPEVLQLIGHAMAELGRTVYASRVLLQVPDSGLTGYARVCALHSLYHSTCFLDAQLKSSSGHSLRLLL